MLLRGDRRPNARWDARVGVAKVGRRAVNDEVGGLTTRDILIGGRPGPAHENVHVESLFAEALKERERLARELENGNDEEHARPHELKLATLERSVRASSSGG